MLVRFWGVRGSLAAPGQSMIEVGGNTACIEVRGSSGALVVIDAGLGLYWLGRSLLAGPHGKGEGETTILLTRTYWDHIQGFPFFIPAFIPGNKIVVHGKSPSHQLQAILEGQMRPAYSPIVSLTNMGAKIEARDLNGSKRALVVDGITVRHEVFKGAGGVPSVGYRLEEEGRSFAYISDVEYPVGAIPPEALRLAKDADVLVHEAYYTNEEHRRGTGGLVGEGFGPAARRGHATFAEALEVAIRGRAKRLLFSHHHPDHDDQAVAAAVESERVRAGIRAPGLSVDTAREGAEVEV